ncbi:CYTH domain-containing protein [Intestinibacillus massiliensis]|nr:CYTH domain-containing protein [Intestinibacillus massiliensis]
MELELKWKADAATQRAAAEWARPLCTGQASYEMDARYYDTADGLLAAQRAGLRLRLENGRGVCCLKCGGGVSGAQHLREEYECAAASVAEGLALLPAQGAPEGLCRALSSAGVQEVCRVRFTRQALTLRDAEMTAELALDCGTLSRGGREMPLCEIELEHKAGGSAAFLALGERLAGAFSLVPEPLTKLARAAAL